MEPIKITQNLINSAASVYANKPAEAAAQISKSAQEFISKLTNSSTEVIENFLKTNTRPVPLRDKDALMYRYNNLLLYRSNGNTAQNLETNLKMCQKHGIAPRFVQYFKLDKDDFLTIMDVNAEKIIPYFKVADKVPQKTKQNFETKIRSLIQNGELNREIFANKNPLFVTPDAKTIVYADWAEVSPLMKSDRAEILQKIKDWHI